MHASTAQLIAAADHLSVIADAIDDRHRLAREEIESLVGSSWRGIAPKTHQELWESWDAGYVDVVGALRAMADKISAAASHFESTDEGNARSVSHSGTGLLNMDVS